MEDKRIIKTKKAIKSTLIDILQEMSFEKVTVTEICRRGIISRITFYTHYEDKYVLAEEIFSDYIAEANDNYHRLQSVNNPKKQAVQGYINLLEAILLLFYDNYRFFSHTTAHENPYLYSVFFDKVFLSVDEYIDRHRGIVPQYPTKQTAALLCNSMFGVINSCIAENMQHDKVKELAHEMYQCLLRSGLFLMVEDEKNNTIIEVIRKWLE